MMHSIIRNKKIAALLSSVFWICVWWMISLVTPDILFASPVETLQALGKMGSRFEFWQSIARTFALIMSGFFAAFILAIIWALLCRSSEMLGTLTKPMIGFMKSVPVACFVVAALIWVSSAYLSFFIAFLVIFPITFVAMQTGLAELDKELSEMAVIFRISKRKRIWKLYFPQLLPHLLGSCRISIGMGWKAGIAGELIGLPYHSVGEQLYFTKLYFATDELFAWMIILVLISVLLEKLIVCCISRWGV